MKRFLHVLLGLRRFLLPLLAVLGAISVFVVAGHSDRPAPPPQVVAPPAVASFPAYIAGSGIIEASSRNIAISTPVGGVVTQIFVEVGSMVKAGDPLFRLDDRDLAAQLQTRRAQLASAKTLIGEAEATLGDVRVQLKLAESITDRRAISEEDLSKRRFAVQLADARLKAAAADVANAEAQVKETETNLERLTVRAPVDGQILQVNIRLGEYAATGVLSTPLMVMGRVDRLNVRVDIDENDAWRFRPGAAARAYLRGNRDLFVDLHLRVRRALRGAEALPDRRQFGAGRHPRAAGRLQLRQRRRTGLHRPTGGRIYRCPAGGYAAACGTSGGSADVPAGRRILVRYRRPGGAILGGAALVGLVAATAGCVVGPDYQPPDASRLPAAWDGAAAAAPAAVEGVPAATPAPGDAAAEDGWANAGWWASFNDPLLPALIEEALAANYDVRRAVAAITEARAAREQARSGLFPTLDQSTIYQHGRGSQTLTNFGGGGFTGTGGITSASLAGDNRFTSEFAAGWEIDLFGKVQRGIEAAGAGIGAAEAAAAGVRLSLAAEVGRTYVDARGLQLRIDITHQQIASQRDTVEITRARAQAGTGAGLDVVRAEAELATTEAQLPPLQAALASDIHRLGVLTGQPPGALTARLADWHRYRSRRKRSVSGFPPT